MRVFITGATGFIGSALVKDLIKNGHQVVGLCRQESKAADLAAAGAEVLRGTVQDVDSLKAGVARADGVVHLAFNHDFSKFAENCEDDRRVIRALGSFLAGSNRPFVVTSGTGMASAAPGQPIREDGPIISSKVIPRAASEEAAAEAEAQGVNVSVVRLPQVHDPYRQGLVSPAIEIARAQGKAAYIGEGSNRWPAAHVSDAAPVYRLALERAEKGAKYHAVAEEGVKMRDIAEAIGRIIDAPAVSISPEEAPAYFGWMALFAQHDMPASSEATRKKLGWNPTGPTMLEDLEQMRINTHTR